MRTGIPALQTTNGEHWTLLYAKDFGRLQFLEGKSPKERYRGRSELHKQADFCRQQVSSADPAVRRAAADFLQMRGRLVLRHLLRRCVRSRCTIPRFHSGCTDTPRMR